MLDNQLAASSNADSLATSSELPTKGNLQIADSNCNTAIVNLFAQAQNAFAELDRQKFYLDTNWKKPTAEQLTPAETHSNYIALAAAYDSLILQAEAGIEKLQNQVLAARNQLSALYWDLDSVDNCEPLSE